MGNNLLLSLLILNDKEVLELKIRTTDTNSLGPSKPGELAEGTVVAQRSRSAADTEPGLPRGALEL